MAKEKNLWLLVRDNLKDFHLQRIETGMTGSGVPDVNGYTTIDLFESTNFSGSAIGTARVRGITADENALAVIANGTAHYRLKIDTPAAVDITIVGMSATVYYISGNATTVTVPAFS